MYISMVISKGLDKEVKLNHPLYSQSFSSKQKTSASVPKSPPLFNSSSPSTAQKPLLPIRHICGLGASVGCERIKRTFNAPRLKAQICLIEGNGFVCSLLNELNSNISLLTLNFIVVDNIFLPCYSNK